MNPSEYQEAARRTLIFEPDHVLSGNDIMLIWCAIGLAGEAGETADNIKKAVLHQHGLDKQKLTDEIGDVLWYLASLCTLSGVDLSDAMERNIAKLLNRYPNGYNAQDSMRRSA